MDNNSKTIAEFLGISPDLVEDTVTVSSEGLRTVHVYPADTGRECPFCGSIDAEAKGRKCKKMKHALFLRATTVFILHQRRFRCRSCGKSFNQRTPFGAKGARLTYETEMLILESLADYNETYASVARRLHVSSTAVIDVFDRRYNPARDRLPEALCIDECYAMGQFAKPYCLILYDWSRKRLVDVLEGREKRQLRSYLFAIPAEERAAVKVVSIDMYETYLDMARAYLPNALVCVDSFHVMQNLTRALDAVRVRVMKGFARDTDEYHYLKTGEWALYADGEPSEKKKRDRVTGRYHNAYTLREEIRGISKELRRAHDYYRFYRFCNSVKMDKARARKWIDFMRKDGSVSDIPEMAAFQRTLTNWRQYIINSFEYEESTGRRISNGPVEGFNSQYKKLMRVSNGLGNFPRFRARLMLCSRKDFTMSSPKGGIKRKKRGRKRGHYNKKKEAKQGT